MVLDQILIKLTYKEQKRGEEGEKRLLWSRLWFPSFVLFLMLPYFKNKKFKHQKEI